MYAIKIALFAAGLLTLGLSASAQDRLAEVSPRVLPAPPPQSTVTLAQETGCNSTSFMSRRCHMVFVKGCRDRKQPADECERTSGYCHSCTDQYVRCKGSPERRKSGQGCAVCNQEYGACISDMVRQYGGKLVGVE